ncbi:MAG TPA: PEGA domain-containing protein [Terriglobales bacterium]|nr:PEGA domain-containing protein [Terriglobales bacterium]
MQNIGRYQIESELGKGAMGLVYKATDPNIGRSVALKTMRLDVHGIEQEEMLRRFKNEARSAGVLSHPNIVTIYDAGEDQGLFYIAMEFIEGKTLAELLQTHRVLPVEQVIGITRNICAGLDFAHNKGIVHRDIKPANIMVTPDGTAKIMDFGIAKVSGSLTSTGQVLGTPNYMSPEQVKGRQLDGRSDLFSLGVMLYEMLTGEKPFMGQGVTTIIYKIVNENPIPPRDLDLTIHPGLSAVVTRTLAKDPYERYQTGAELIRDLESYKSYGTDANSTMISATGAFDRSTVSGEGDATLIGPSPATAKPAAAVPAPAPAAAQATGQQTSASPAPPPQAANATGSATARTPAVSPLPPIPGTASVKGPKTVSQKIAAAGSRGPGKLLIGAFAVLVLIAGVVGIARHNARKRAAENNQQEFQQAMQQAQQAIDLAKQAEQLGPPAAAPPATSADATPPTSADATPEPPATDANAAPATPQPDSVAAAATPTARKAKPKLTTGDLQIVSEPAGAHVDIDGQTRPEWVTPFLADKLPAGKHTVTYTMPNFGTEKRTADVVAGKKGTVDAKLATTIGTVKVASTPAGSDITLNGHPTGQKTPATLNLPPGNHVIKLHKDGFQDATENVTVALGQTQNVSGKLQAVPVTATSAPAAAKPNGTGKEANPFAKIGRFFRGGGTERGTLSIKTTPPGAKVTLNGEASSSVTPVKIETKTGKYKVELELDGYQKIEREVTVEKGKQTGIAEVLVHK